MQTFLRNENNFHSRPSALCVGRLSEKYSYFSQQTGAHAGTVNSTPEKSQIHTITSQHAPGETNTFEPFNLGDGGTSTGDKEERGKK